MVEHTIQSTHANTHILYSMEVMDVLCLDKTNKVAKYKDRGNTRAALTRQQAF